MGIPLTSGFFSKEEILGAAYHECGYLFTAAAFTAMLTSFYMSRCVIVAFFGKARSENADHAHEAPLIMTAPLMLLSIFALLSGYGFFSDKLQALVPHAEHAEGHGIVMGVSIAAVVIGAGLAFFLYSGKDKDPLNIKLFANRFYIDEIYAVIVKVFQDRLAWIVSGLESIFADGLVARLPAAIACRVGKTARLIQSGHLQGYTFVLGAGLILAIYLVVQVLPKH
jgi:NADH-quinone oxidoreductase subunit L